MRSRAVGGYEPDDRDQHELSELWRTSRTAVALSGPERQALFARHGGERGARIDWVVEQFLKAHAGEPHVARKWVYVWSEANLGRHSTGPVEASPGRSSRRSSSRGRRSSSRVPMPDMSWLGPPPPVQAREPQPTPKEMEQDIAVVCSRVEPSKGHIAWLDDGAREAYEQGGEVYLAPSDRPLDIHGYRQGGRWEASRAHWERYFDALFRSRVSGPPMRG